MLTWFLIVSLGLIALVELGLGIWVWRNSNEPTALPFSLAMVCAAAWAIFHGLDVFSPTVGEKVFFAQIRLTFIAFLVPCWYLWIRAFTTPGETIGRWRLALIWGFFISQSVMVLTTNYHQLYRFDYHLQQIGQFSLLGFTKGPAQILLAIWANTIMLMAMGNLFLFAIRASHVFDVRRSWIVFGFTLLPTFTDGLFLAGHSPIPGYNLTPHVLAFAGLVNP